MQWTPLQLSLLPLCANECQQAIQFYKELLIKIQKYNKIEDIKSWQNLHQDLQYRSVLLQQFYRQHHYDPMISIFHMLRMKIQKILHQSQSIKIKHQQFSIMRWNNSLKDDIQPSTILMNKKQSYFTNIISKQQKISQQINHKIQIKKNKLSQKKEIGQVIKTKSSINKNNTLKYNSNASNSIGISKKDHRSNKVYDKTNIKKKSQQTWKKSPFREKKTEEINKKQDKISSNSKKEEMIIQEEQIYNESNKLDQFKFTIKMTKQQYRSLLQLKRQLILEDKK